MVGGGTDGTEGRSERVASGGVAAAAAPADDRAAGSVFATVA
jgi:hypothetical protein